MLMQAVYAVSGFVLGCVVGSVMSNRDKFWRDQMSHVKREVLRYHLPGSEWVSITVGAVESIFAGRANDGNKKA